MDWKRLRPGEYVSGSYRIRKYGRASEWWLYIGTRAIGFGPSFGAAKARADQHAQESSKNGTSALTPKDER